MARRSDLHWQAVTPSIFLLRARSNLIPQVTVGVTVENACMRGDLPFTDPHGNLRLASDVFDPSGGLTCFGEQIKTVAENNEPNLNLARQTRPTPGRRQIQDLLARNIADE